MSWDNNKDCCCDGSGNNQLIVRTIPLCVYSTESVFADMSQVVIDTETDPVSGNVVSVNISNILLDGVEGSIEWYLEDPSNLAITSLSASYLVNYTPLGVDGIQCPTQSTGDTVLSIRAFRSSSFDIIGESRIVFRLTFDSQLYNQRFHFVNLNNNTDTRGVYRFTGTHSEEILCGGPDFFIDPVTRQIGPDITLGGNPYLNGDGTVLFNNGDGVSVVELAKYLSEGTTSAGIGFNLAISGNANGCETGLCPIDFSIGYTYNDILYTSSDDLVSDIQAAFPEYEVSYNESLCQLDMLYLGTGPEPFIPEVIDLIPPIVVNRPIANDDTRSLELGVATNIDVRLNDAWCETDQVTTWKLIVGTEVNCTVLELNGGDGNFDVTTLAPGNWQFQYEIYCDGFASGETAIVSGVTEAPPMAVNDLVGTRNLLEPFDYDTTANDILCPGVTTWSVTNIVNANVISTPTDTDGIFNITPLAVGPFSFDYELVCNSVPSGEIATVSGDCDCLVTPGDIAVSISSFPGLGSLGDGSISNPYQEGDTIVYTSTVSNSSSYFVDDLVYIFSDLSPVNITNDPDNITGFQIDLNAGQTSFATYSYTVTATDVSNGQVTNTSSYSHLACAGLVDSVSDVVIVSSLSSIPVVCDGNNSCPLTYPARFINGSTNPMVYDETEAVTEIESYMQGLGATMITVDLVSCVVTFIPPDTWLGSEPLEIELCDDCPEYNWISSSGPYNNYEIEEGTFNPPPAGGSNFSCTNFTETPSLFTYFGEGPDGEGSDFCNSLVISDNDIAAGSCLYKLVLTVSRSTAMEQGDDYLLIRVSSLNNTNGFNQFIRPLDVPVLFQQYTFEWFVDPLIISEPSNPGLFISIEFLCNENEVWNVHEWRLVTI